MLYLSFQSLGAKVTLGLLKDTVRLSCGHKLSYNMFFFSRLFSERPIASVFTTVEAGKAGSTAVLNTQHSCSQSQSAH